MSREIKFRAWDEENKEMISGDDLAFEEYDLLKNWLSQEGIMQFTGLCDKAGKEIYEGDIVNAYDGRIKGPVIFDPRGLAFGIPNGVNEIYQFSLNFLESKDIEVVGNIFEDGEMLK